MSAIEIEEEDQVIEIDSLHWDHGSIVEFLGHAEDDPEKECVVSADHRPAQSIIEALEAGEPVLVDPEPWAVRWLS